MPKLTAKYKAALDVAKVEGLQAEGEALYQVLAKLQYFWDADDQVWVVANLEDADPASQVLRIRVWTDLEIVADLARDLEMAWHGLGFGLVEKSKVYPCRPPKQLDGRVYLTFALPDKSHVQR